MPNDFIMACYVIKTECHTIFKQGTEFVICHVMSSGHNVMVMISIRSCHVTYQVVITDEGEVAVLAACEELLHGADHKVWSRLLQHQDHDHDQQRNHKTLLTCLL